MNVLELKLAQHLGIVNSDRKPYLLKILFDCNNINHIDALHASASYALAEITSGYFLNINFPNIASRCIPILRRSKVKYTHLVKEDLYSNAVLANHTHESLTAELEKNRKALFTIDVKLYSNNSQIAFQGEFEWFVTLV
jgi:hypothetical protein